MVVPPDLLYSKVLIIPLTKQLIMTTIRLYLILVFLIFSGLGLMAQDVWNKEGNTIEGQATDNLGTSVSVSANGTIMAVGSAGFNSSTGKVGVYQIAGSTWQLKGAELTGLGTSDNFGFSVSLSADGNTLAVGAHTSDEGFDEFSVAGYVKVFTWNGSAWVQKGAMLSAVEASENFGNSVSISADGNFLAVGSPGYNGGGDFRGAVRVYEWNGSVWSKIGTDIVGTTDFEGLGTVVSISVAGNDKVLAVSSPSYESAVGLFDFAGKVSIFSDSEGSWGGSWTDPQVLIGNPDDYFGAGLSLSADGTRLAVGAPKNELGFSDYNGFVKLYDYQSSNWVQLGATIFSQTGDQTPIEFDFFGKSVALSGDGNTVIIGAPNGVEEYSPNGRAEVHTWTGSAWELVSNPIIGTEANESAGRSVAISADGNRVVLGSPTFGFNAPGRVRSYQLGPPDSQGPVLIEFSAEKSITNNNSPFLVYLTFDEAVVDFSVADISVTNGTADNLVEDTEATLPYSYQVQITPDGQGDILIQLLADAVQDLVGNGNDASEVLTVVYDIIAPTVQITGTPNGSTPFTVTITFSEPVEDFGQANITLLNATLQNFAGSLAEYTVELTPTGGDIVMTIAAGVTSDIAGNGNIEGTITFDQTSPTVIISTLQTLTNENPFTITITFDEVVSGLELTDLMVTNGEASDLTTEDQLIYTAQITALADEEVSVQLTAGAAVDASGNSSDASNLLIVNIDTTAPVAVLESATLTTNGQVDFQVLVSFNESVSDPEISDFFITNAVVSSVTPVQAFGNSFIALATITPNGEDEITIQLQANAVTDLAGNFNLASNEIVVTYDGEAPTVQLTGTPNGLNAFELAITFSEPVFNFVFDDIIVENATLFGLVGFDANYSVEVTPSGTGNVTVRIPAGVATDAAGNENEEVLAIFDVLAPQALISTQVADTMNLSSFSIAITFDEAVSGLELLDLEISNGVLSGLISSSDSEYTATVSEFSDGSITIQLPQGAAQDATGNGNTASNLLTIVSDRTGPTLTLSNIPDRNNGAPFTAYLLFSERIVGEFLLEDIQVSNAVLSNLVGPSLYIGGLMLATFTVTPNGEGDITLSVDAGVVNDRYNNPSIASETVTVIYDVTGPEVTIVASESVVGAGPFDVSFVFNEKTIGFESSDVTIVNASLGALTTGDSLTYIGQFSPTSPELIRISVLANVAQDLAGNGNTASAVKEIVVDMPPSVQILDAPTTRNLNPFTITIQFSETVTGFELADITLANAAASNFAGTGASYTALITPNGQGDISISVAADVANDTGGNGNLASNTLNVTFDNVAPTLSISGVPANTVFTTNPITLTFTFSEAVSGFTMDEIEVSNATKANFTSISTSVYTATVAPKNEGSFTASVAANAATDAAGNGNIAANVSMTYNRKYSGGTGTASDPYLIANEADLRELSANTGDFSAHFKQIADIKMSATAFTPIGFNLSFKGTYDGDGNVIDGLSNLNYEITKFVVALFAIVTDGTIKNLGVTSIKIKAPILVSGLVGSCTGCTILNCYTTGEIEATGNGSASGLVSIISSGSSIINSFSDMKLNGLYSSGLVTESIANPMQITNSYSLSDIISRNNSTSRLYGALLGANNNNDYIANIQNSYFAGTIQTNGIAYLGMMDFNDRGVVTNSFWDKELSGIERTDGGGTPLTTNQMRTLKTFTDANWDFTNTWHFPFNYPILKWQVDRMKEFTISGRVVDQNGSVFSAGAVTAYVFGGESKTVRLDAQGRYKLDLPKGFHSLYVTPDNPNAHLTTFYGNTNNLFKAKLIFYNHSAVDVKMIAKSQTNLLDGNGRVSGRVVSTAGGVNRIIQGRVATGDPVAGVSVMLIRTSDEQVMTTVVTDANGDFEIVGIPAGDYRLVVYIAGIATDLGNNNLSFDGSATNVSVTAVVSEEGVTVSIDRILGLDDEIAVKFYPNPASTYVNIQVPGEVKLRVFNLSGVMLIEQNFVDQTVLDVSGLKSGVHLIEISNASGRTVRKLVKSN